MSPSQALDILNQATDPRVIGRLTRSDYAACEEALKVLAGLIERESEPVAASTKE